MLPQENFERLRARLTQKLGGRKQANCPNSRGTQARLAKLDTDIKAAVAQLKPEYGLAI